MYGEGHEEGVRESTNIVMQFNCIVYKCFYIRGRFESKTLYTDRNSKHHPPSSDAMRRISKVKIEHALQLRLHTITATICTSRPICCRTGLFVQLHHAIALALAEEDNLHG